MSPPALPDSHPVLTNNTAAIIGWGMLFIKQLVFLLTTCNIFVQANAEYEYSCLRSPSEARLSVSLSLSLSLSPHLDHCLLL